MFQTLVSFAVESNTLVFENNLAYYQQAKFKPTDLTKNFYFVRHGQTDTNKYHVMQSTAERPLHELEKFRNNLINRASCKTPIY